jgi:hypothetical protein
MFLFIFTKPGNSALTGMSRRRYSDSKFQSAVYALDSIDTEMPDVPDSDVDTDQIASDVSEGLASAISEAVDKAVSSVASDMEEFKEEVERKLSDAESAIEEAKDALNEADETIAEKDREIEELTEKLEAAEATAFRIPEALRPAFAAFLAAIEAAMAPKPSPDVALKVTNPEGEVVGVLLPGSKVEPMKVGESVASPPREAPAYVSDGL